MNLDSWSEGVKSETQVNDWIRPSCLVKGSNFLTLGEFPCHFPKIDVLHTSVEYSGSMNFYRKKITILRFINIFMFEFNFLQSEAMRACMSFFIPPPPTLLLKVWGSILQDLTISCLHWVSNIICCRGKDTTFRVRETNLKFCQTCLLYWTSIKLGAFHHFAMY